MKVTIKDIARESGVSISTVSLVLNNKPSRVSQVTKDKIIEVVHKLNYTPNLAARSLVTRATKTIGLIIPDIENAFFSSLSKAVEDYSRTLGYMVLLMNSNDLHEMSIELINLLFNRGIDGLLVVSANESYQLDKQKEIKELLTSINIPIVMIDRVFDAFSIDKVYFNNQLGGYLATKHLINNGHKRIACITGPKGTKSSEERLSGFYKAMEESHLQVDELLIVEGNYHFESGAIKMSQLLDQDFTAIFAFNDLMAFGAIRSLNDAFKKIPEDYSIVGYDHFALADLLNSRLDSIEQDSKKLGYSACQILYSKMIEKQVGIKEICLDPVLTINGSVKRINE
ncbi:MAG: LacI family transcriptional regulator [Haloplasmataceae bacterium]|jgi:LacI family transcriptional regulator|nr:LacI family transcriptional regulator [Haloplasmataceae bacterium]